jgi:hypothetical protein
LHACRSTLEDPLDNPISGGNWTYNGASEITNMPENINLQNFNLQLGIFVGLMNF